MKIIEIIRNNNELLEAIRKFCDIEIYEKNQSPDDFNGTITWNINGLAFGRDASGGEYILLDDNTIGFNGSEGECGRVAENFTELFELLINISCWMDYLDKDLYRDDEILNNYIIKTENEYIEYFYKSNYYIIQKELSEKLSIEIYSNKTDLLKRFYKTATREPHYVYTFENKNERMISEGSLIE
jgi:hypothetical protein